MLPENTNDWVNLGIAFQQDGQIDKAKKAYEKALEINPNSAEACTNLANTLQELGRLDEAEASYNQAIALKPDFSRSPHATLGVTLTRTR